jgi:hypothetical protein
LVTTPWPFEKVPTFFLRKVSRSRKWLIKIPEKFRQRRL